MATTTDIKGLLTSIVKSSMDSVIAGNRAVITPKGAANIAKEIIEDAESGSIARFERSMDKVKNLIDKLGININDFNKGLGERLEQLEKQKTESEQEVELLRAQNIVAETQIIKEGEELRYETKILTNKEIKDKQKLIKEEEKLLKTREKDILKNREELLEKESLSQEEQQKIIDDEKELAKIRERLEKGINVLNPNAGDQTPDTQMPPFLASLLDSLKAPFVAIGDAVSQVGGIFKEAGQTIEYFTGLNLGKTFGGLKDIVGKFTKFFTLTRLAIMVAIGAVIAGIYYFRDKIFDIGAKIKEIIIGVGDFFKDLYTRVTDFFKTAINAVIKLLNKIPGVNIELLETSSMKKEKEKKKIKEATDEGEMAAAVIQSEIGDDSGVTTRGNIGKSPADKRKEKLKKFDEEAFIKASEEQHGSHIAPFELSDREKFKFMRTGKAPDPNELTSLSKENMEMKSQAPIIINNSPSQSNINQSSQQVSGFIDNKNADDTFINLNY